MWIYNIDLPTARATQLPSSEAGSAQGIKKDGAGFYGASGAGPQSAMTPVVQAAKQYGSTFAATNVAGHQGSPCFMITQVKNGQWQRVYPAQAGTFDCKAGNLVTVQRGA
jgi:hypothetical protein